ncbi:MAG: translation initiation factor IF-2 subunit alpha [Candidatus Aenigmatarchaeota archaeon]
MVKRKGTPDWGEFVLCTVERITPYAAWCKLDEYPNIEGMIHVSEVSGKWVHDIREFVKPNKQYVAKVVKIDYQTNAVNLSLKRVTKVDEREKMNAFRRNQRAEKMLEMAGREMGKTLEQSYEEIGYLIQEKFGELFVAFQDASKEPEVLVKAGIPEKWIAAISKILEKSFQEKDISIKAEVELKSFSKDGLEDIKKILEELEKKTGVSIRYISAPKYRIEVSTKDPKQTEKKLKENLEEIVEKMKTIQGEGSYKFIKQ